MRKTARMKSIRIFHLFLILTLSIAVVLSAYLAFYAPGDRELTGEWTGKLDMTKQAAARAYGWLQDIEAVSVTPEAVEEHMQELTIEVNL